MISIVTLDLTVNDSLQDKESITFGYFCMGTTIPMKKKKFIKGQSLIYKGMLAMLQVELLFIVVEWAPRCSEIRRT